MLDKQKKTRAFISPAAGSAALLLVAAACLGPRVASADDYHYVNMLVGDRASGMGGAYTAVSDDPSGLYYNPAGTAYTFTRNLSASANAYHNTRTVYKDVIGGRDWVRESSVLIPNFFGITQPLANGTIGFSYVVPDAIQEDQDETFNNVTPSIERYHIDFNNKKNVYKFGPSYAMGIGDSLSVGMTLYVHYGEQENINNQVVTLDSATNDREWNYVQLQTKEWGIEPVLGVMWSPGDTLSVGLTLRKTEIFNSRSYYYQSCRGSSASSSSLCQPGVINTFERHFDAKREYPLETRLGIAWFPSPSFLLSADFGYWGKAKDKILDRTMEATWNAALGMEYYLSNRWALRGGLYTNRANTPSDVTIYDHINYYGGSLSLTRFTRSSSITLGISEALGSGEAQVFNSNFQNQDVSSQVTTVFLSTQYVY